MNGGSTSAPPAPPAAGAGGPGAAPPQGNRDPRIRYANSVASSLVAPSAREERGTGVEGSREPASHRAGQMPNASAPAASQYRQLSAPSTARPFAGAIHIRAGSLLRPPALGRPGAPVLQPRPPGITLTRPQSELDVPAGVPGPMQAYSSQQQQSASQQQQPPPPPPQQQQEEGGAPEAAAAADEAPPPPLESPGVRDQVHSLKGQWRCGVDAETGRIVALGVTVTASDCGTGRLRPPRNW